MNTFQEVLTFLHSIIWPHLIVFGGFALGLLVVIRIFRERRTPSNTLAWTILIFSAPYLGVPLYFLFGGRKSRRLVEHKKAIRALAENVYSVPCTSHTPPIWKPLPPSLTGNHFELYSNGQNSLAALLREIDQAKNSIYIATYILGKDAIGQTVLSHLTRKAKQGLDIRLLIDALGSFTVRGPLLKPLKAAGGKIARFMPVLPLQTQTSSNLRNHRKIALFDHKRALIGGQNLDQRFMGTVEHPALFEDFSALLSGPVVAQLNRIFISDWCFASGESPGQFKETLSYDPPATGHEAIRAISSGPDVEGDPLWESLITLIQDCKESITIVTPYFLPDEVLLRSLIVKARTGRKVRLIIPKKSNHTLVDWARPHFLRPLYEAGAEILLHDGKMLHAKLFIVDNAIAMIGSANFDLRSLFVNFEVGVFLTSSTTIETLNGWINGLSPHLKNYKNTPHPSSLAQWKEDIAYILVPLL